MNFIYACTHISILFSLKILQLKIQKKNLIPTYNFRIQSIKFKLRQKNSYLNVLILFYRTILSNYSWLIFVRRSKADGVFMYCAFNVNCR